jgi:hypothetical protein
MVSLKGIASTDLLEVERDGVSYQAAKSQFENVLIPPVFTYAINSNLSQQNLRTIAVNAGWDQKAEVHITLNSGKYITSNNRATAALTINGTWPRGVKFICNGNVLGKGGGTTGTTGQAGGVAINVGSNVTIDCRTGYIGGGGGQGGAPSSATTYGGGGAGAGKGNAGVGGTGGSGQGGRKIPGNGGTGKKISIGSSVSTQSGLGAGGQAGGGGGSYMEKKNNSHTNQNKVTTSRAGGGGGGYGAKGGNSGSAFNQTAQGTSTSNGGNGGANNANGANYSISNSGGVTGGGGGGAGGKAVAKNGKTVSWVGGTSHVYGAIS